MGEVRERVKKILENHISIRFIEGVTDEIINVFEPDSTVNYSDKDFTPTPDSKMSTRMKNCDHKFKIMETSGMNNGHGCPTWKCMFCGYKKISM